MSAASSFVVAHLLASPSQNVHTAWSFSSVEEWYAALMTVAVVELTCA
jgi:hypothetical protein